MRCTKCGFHSAILTSVLTSYPPINVFQCSVDDCNHTWKVREQRASRVVDPNHLSLEERVELLERLVARLQREDRSLPIPYPRLIGELHKKYAQECIDRAKEGKG